MGKILILLILTTTAIAQERLLVNPNNEVIPLQKGESAFEVAKKYVLKRSSSSECPDKITFAYRPKDLPNTNFGAMHGDVLGMWFIAPASGTIDTLFWMAFAVGAPDSLIYIRIFKSIIYPGRGPGYPPYPAPCIPWGYYVNTNDLDQGVAPFRDEATDTHWVSTLPGITTFYPLGDELWGNGGFPVIDHANSINALPLNVLGYQPTVKEGDPFFITMRVPMCAVCLDDRTEWAATGFRVSPHDELYPSRLWKFYEHDRGPSNCSNFPIDSMKRGWVARGGFGVDTLDVAVYNWWYVMSVTSNTSPTFISIDNLTHTLSTNQREVQAEIEDCNATNPESAGVASATLYYTINGVTKDSGGISMTNIGGNLWSGFIPATSAGSIITYYIRAQDLNGESTTSGVFSYQVVTLRNEYFYADTGKTCVPKNISGSGTLIPPSQFFLPSSAGSRAEAGDDGTAGPFDIGGPMEFNGNTVRYAWIGVNGAIALTASESDTQHLNSNGYFNGLWTIPSGAQHNIPKNFIAAYWANHQFAQDSPFIQCGRILYRNGEDTCQFVVEWDSLGLLKTLGPDCGETTFRIILNRCDGTIEFQYDNVGTIGLDSSALVGIEADSTGPRPGGWIFVNKNGYPTETRPRNNWCMKIYQAIPVVIRDGWNIVSVPVIPPNMNYSRSLLFPSSISPCFHYRSDDPGELTRGEGCWLKFRGDQIVGIPGIPIHSLDIPLFDKWNMIGSISKPVPVGSLSFTEATMSSIGFFGFDGGVGYYLEDTIVPGKGYWVKINATGQNPLLHMSAAATPQKFDNPVSSELMQMSKLIVVDNAGYKQTLYFGDNGQVKSPINIFELPPPAPVGMDVRFASGRMLEVIDGKEAQEFPILISSAAYPLTISWELKNQAVQAWLCLDKSTVLLRDYGSIKIANPQSQISLRLEGSSEIPLTFALDQNYPNPFNPRTDIRLQIADHSHVVLKVFNVLGQEVATLVNEKKAPGEYTVTWDANNKPSGVYFYRLQTEKFIAVKKMLLIQ